ncbi:hypothetical protein E6O75_ATG09559 [Venturia nashicola]|uniref:Uncharacterized protein n=1 Tax=Venturia nashicola TaxID=86259 RepID=A0A4Z1NM69_9PEZI|nr:hypothetical protein E6O75_ATG09559 [Venturia nashicola]
MFSTSLSGQTSPAEFSTLESFPPVSRQTSNPISMSRQPSPLSTLTPESTSPVSTAPTSPCSTQAWAPVKTGLFYSNFPDPCGFSGLNKGLFGRDLNTTPRLPPLDVGSSPLKLKKVKSSNIPTTTKKTHKIETIAYHAPSITESPDPTPSKAHKVLGQKAGPHEALRVKEIKTVKKTSDRKSRIPSALRSLSKFGFSGVKDDDNYDAPPNRPLLATTPSPTRSEIPKISTPEGFVHVSGSGISTSQSPRSTPEPSPANTPSTVFGRRAQKPLAKPKAVTGDEQVIYTTPAVLRASDFTNKDSGKARTSKSWSKIPCSPARGESVGGEFLNTFTFPLTREIHGKKVMQDVQAMVATPQHRSMLPLAISANKPLPPLPADTTPALSSKMQQFNSIDDHMVYLESPQSTEESQSTSQRFLRVQNQQVIVSSLLEPRHQ